MKRYVIANWKMNLTLPEAVTLAQGSIKIAEEHHTLQIILAPSLPWLVPVRESLKWMPPNLHLASQVVSPWEEGAYTGDVAATQLKPIVKYCLVGHSERRRYHHESGQVISHQVKQLLNQAIHPVVCFGEMNQSQQSTFSPQITVDLKADLAGLTPEEVGKCLFAYEPLWAIGTGHPAIPDYIRKVTHHMKEWFRTTYRQETPILYGGSVTEANAADLGDIREIDGLLVGGASLHIKQFRQVCSLFFPHV